MIVGLTGGIGSGKTTVGRYFKAFNIPIYIADVEAKKLMNGSKVLKRELIRLFGNKAYENDELNRAYIASKIFQNKELLAKMNAIVHPKVAMHFKRWYSRQQAPYVIKEAAIIFENNLQSQYDVIITVVADRAAKIERLKKRDNTDVDRIEAIMDNQMDDDQKVKRSDYVIYNNDLKTLESQVEKIHKILLDKSAQLKSETFC